VDGALCAESAVWGLWESGVWLVKFGDLEISLILSFETWGWSKIGNWSLGLASA
jgi:hypothetical protein